MLATPPLLSSPTVIIKQPRQHEKLIKQKFLLISAFSFIYFLFYLFMLNHRSRQEQGGGKGGTHVSFVVRTNKHSRRTIRNLRKKAKVEEEAEEEGQLPVSLSELLFVARVRDLLNL